MGETRGTYRPRDPARPTPGAELARRVVLAMARLDTASPTAGQVADALGAPPEWTRATLRRLHKRGVLEVWDCPDRIGEIRAMISARSARSLGLVAGPGGRRWIVPPGLPPAEPPTIADPRPRPSRARRRVAVETTEANPFAWVRERNSRRAALALTLKAMREGWPLPGPDRARLREAMEWLRDSEGIRDRERPAVAEILGRLDGEAAGT